MIPDALSGRIEAGTHIFPLKVYWEDTDAAGIVYYANYLKFIERARSALLALAGVSQTELLSGPGLAFAVKACAIEYHRPARLDDRIEVRTRLKALSGASLELMQDVTRGAEAIASALVRIACIDRAGRPKRLPPALRQALQHVA
ncbi:MAG: tol-pal system-associated acyl-CoA thioesterase [Alphaproteobacteria bacterium]|nr:tol-pal system-associated acyl-CoA thioesterase [Alphaproteobacteria bacterium]